MWSVARLVRRRMGDRSNQLMDSRSERVAVAARRAADRHHLSGELTLTVGNATKVMRAGDCVVIPPHVPHGGGSGPEGCTVLDVFSPPRAALISLMTT
jgi:cupin domain